MEHTAAIDLEHGPHPPRFAEESAAKLSSGWRSRVVVHTITRILYVLANGTMNGKLGAARQPMVENS
jgi:hypothetical protein